MIICVIANKKAGVETPAASKISLFYEKLLMKAHKYNESQ